MKSSKKGISQVQSIAIIAIIVIVAVIAGSAYYVSTIPSGVTTVTQTKTTTATGGTTTVTQTATQTITQTSTVTQTETTTVFPEPPRVAIVFSASPDVSTWDRVGFEGVKEAEKRYGIEVTQLEFTQAIDWERALTTLANEGFDIIFSHDTINVDMAATVAENFPDIWFGQAYAPFGYEFGSNFFSYAPDQVQGAYLAGMVAGGVSEGGVIGLPVGAYIPVVIANVEAFKMGVKLVNPDAQVITIEMQTWWDPIKGKESAQALVDLGCDFFAHYAGAAEAGVIEVLDREGIYAVAVSPLSAKDFYDKNVATGTYRLDLAIADIIGEYFRTGTLVNTEYYGGIDLGWADIEYDIPEMVSEDLRQQIEDVRQAMLSGELVIPFITELSPP
jgi:basic membrane lipoprotein Med (substrate-binding protein (PBP1-ABC) superfamily)